MNDRDAREQTVTGRIPIDVVEFVEARFAAKEFAAVFKVLAADVFASRKLMRAALFLADGDMALLKHYAKTGEANPADVLVRAEFVIAATKDPLCAGDFSELYRPGNTPERHGPAKANPLPTTERVGTQGHDYHLHLKHREFQLGNATYVVAEEQPTEQYVNCHRTEGANTRLVRLPYVFVMDRLAERIELRSDDLRGF